MLRPPAPIGHEVSSFPAIQEDAVSDQVSLQLGQLVFMFRFTPGNWGVFRSMSLRDGETLQTRLCIDFDKVSF